MPSRRRMRPTAPGSVAASTAARMRCLSLALNLRRLALAVLGLTCGSGILDSDVAVGPGAVESSWRSRSGSLRSPPRSRQPDSTTELTDDRDIQILFLLALLH